MDSLQSQSWLRKRLVVAAPIQLLLVLSVAGALLLAGCFSGSSVQHLQKAEELSRAGQVSEAILEYRAHITERLALEQRPEWENPYFYLIMIGDLELQRGQVFAAHSAYQLAEEKGVHNTLIADRYRAIARWYEEQGRLNEAFLFLQQHRDIDPLLFDVVADRIAREMVEQEERDREGQH